MKNKSASTMIDEVTLNISSIYTKRGMLMKACLESLNSSYRFSEMHTLDYIGKNSKANVTRIADHLGMTRGAISKIVKRLLRNRHISSYRLECNRKEIYYDLTEKGKELFCAHEEVHRGLAKMEAAFFRSYSAEQLEAMSSFLREYNIFITALSNK